MSDSPQERRGEERPGGGHWRSIGERRQQIVSVREEMVEQRGPVGAAIDWIGRVLSGPVFFTLFLLAHLAWVVANVGWVPGVEPWDPYPFMFLATIASGEAPFVALLILMRQQRDRRVNELRDEVSLQVALHVERENTVTLRVLQKIAERLDLELGGDEVEELAGDLDPEALMSTVRERLDEATDGEPVE